MNPCLIYSLKVALGTAAFYLVYLLLFRKQKQFLFNRLYLIGSVCMSFGIPLITITITRTAPKQMVLITETAMETIPAGMNAPAGFDFQQLLLWGYGIVIIFFFLHLLTGYIRAISIIRKSRKAIIHGIPVFVTGKDVHPFTFFSRIVISADTLSHPGLDMILNHENIHAREKHTYDILLAEMMFPFQWFNPFAWLLKDALKNNLEFLTDQKVTDQNNMQSYQMAMVSLADKRGVAPFLNALNGDDLKNRIIMMKKKTVDKNKLSRRLTVIPLLVILILGLSNKEFKAAPLSENIISEEMIHELHSGNGDSTDTLKHRKKEIRVIKTQGDSVRTFVVSGTGESDDSDRNLSRQKNKIVIRHSREAGDTCEVIKITGKGGEKEPLYILDGEEVKTIDGISPDHIESISVLKNESATKIYGEKGKNGVVIITSKESAQQTNKPLVIVDGTETDKKIADINPNDIQSVTVWKGDKAVEKYGGKGQNGVIIIAMKHSNDVKNSSAVQTIQDLKKQIASTIRYPCKAQESGQQGTVKTFAFIDGNGEVILTSESEPRGEVIPVEEFVVVGYDQLQNQKTPPTDLSSLNQEAATCIKNLPEVNIPEFKNKWVAFQFKFMLQ